MWSASFKPTYVHIYTDIHTHIHAHIHTHIHIHRHIHIHTHTHAQKLIVFSLFLSRLFFVIFSTGCQSHSASNTSSVYSSFNHYTELLQSICEIAALRRIPPRPGYDCDHLSGLIYVCGG